MTECESVGRVDISEGPGVVAPYEIRTCDLARHRPGSGACGVVAFPSQCTFEESAGGGQRLVAAYVTIAPGGPGIRDGAGISAYGQPGPSRGSAPAAAGPSTAVLAAKDPAAIASAEEVLRTGSIEDFLSAAIALYPGVKKPVDAVYAAATEHPDANVRLNALSVVAAVGSGEEARTAALERAADDLDPTVQARARQMLGRPGAAAAPPIGRRGR
jgi:hypothetical protein